MTGEGVLPRLLIWAALLWTLATVAGSWELAVHSWRWELARCGKVPDEYYPELGWLIMVLPIAVLAFGLAAAAGLLRRRMGWWVAVLLAPALVGAGYVSVEIWEGVHSCQSEQVALPRP